MNRVVWNREERKSISLFNQSTDKKKEKFKF